MRYIKTDFTKVIPWDVAFPNNEFGKHGGFKVGFGIGKESIDNPVSVCGKYNVGNRLLEVADFGTGDSNMGAMLGGDRNLVIADKPFALAEDTDCHILGVLEYRIGKQPKLKVDGKYVTGGAARFSSFVSKTGAADEDPSPRKVRDTTHGGKEYEVNRETGHAAWGDYYYHLYRLKVNEGQPYNPMSVKTSGHTPKTDTVFPEPVEAKGDVPVDVVSGVRMQMQVKGVWVMGTWVPDKD